MFFLFFTLNFAGGYREVEIPSPIPNLEVKHFIADNTAGSPGGNVGRCQLLSFLQSKLFSIWTFPSSFRKKLFFRPFFLVWVLAFELLSLGWLLPKLFYIVYNLLYRYKASFGFLYYFPLNLLLTFVSLFEVILK